MRENEIATKIIGAAISVHQVLGPGLVENAYLECLHYKLLKEGIIAKKQVPMPVYFEDVSLDCGYRLDLLVENKVVVELKSVDIIHNIHLAQMLTYLKLGDFKLGLLINFNVVLLRQGIKRIANGLET